MTEFNFSIIIASVGRQSLLSVLKCLNDSTRLPKEVIICLPQQDKYEIDINFICEKSEKRSALENRTENEHLILASVKQ